MALRARDLRSNILSMGFEKGVVHTVELMIEESIGYRQNLVQMAELQSQMLDKLADMVDVSGHMRQRLDEMKRREEQYDSVRSEDPNTQAD